MHVYVHIGMYIYLCICIHIFVYITLLFPLKEPRSKDTPGAISTARQYPDLGL